LALRSPVDRSSDFVGFDWVFERGFDLSPTLPVLAVAAFGSETSTKRAGQPVEVAKGFVFLASEDSTYLSGQVLHPNGGDIGNA